MEQLFSKSKFINHNITKDVKESKDPKGTNNNKVLN